MVIPGVDGKIRCFGGVAGKELFTEYHDKEWGIPSHDDQHLFEMLVLEGAQAGLSWETVLKKREGYRKAFHHFNPARVATMKDEELEALLHNPDIIRNRLKINAARQNAQVFLQIQHEFGSFDKYVWAYVNEQPLINHRMRLQDVPSYTAGSDALSKDLKKRRMKFVGTTIMYAFMQAVGMVNDHISSCWRSKR